MTAKLWNAKALSIQQWASRCRIIFDKGMHGRNLLKTARTEAEKGSLVSVLSVKQRTLNFTGCANVAIWVQNVYEQQPEKRLRRH